MIELTPRLALCAAMASRAGRAVDVGCDHAHLAIRLVEEGKADTALAADIREGPLENARANIRSRGLQEKISTMLTCGLEGVSPTGSDLVAICGMGGETIAEILSAAPWTKSACLILQPMTKAYRLRFFLAGAGYSIVSERLVMEDRRIYTAMEVTGGEYQGPDHFLYSAALMSDPLFEEYMGRIIRKVRRVASASRDERARKILSQLEGESPCL